MGFPNTFDIRNPLKKLVLVLSLWLITYLPSSVKGSEINIPSIAQRNSRRNLSCTGGVSDTTWDAAEACDNRVGCTN